MHSEIFLGQLALRFDARFKWLLRAVSSPVTNLACSITCMKRIVLYAVRNNLHAWVEHYPVTSIAIFVLVGWSNLSVLFSGLQLHTAVHGALVLYQTVRG